LIDVSWIPMDRSIESDPMDSWIPMDRSIESDPMDLPWILTPWILKKKAMGIYIPIAQSTLAPKHFSISVCPSIGTHPPCWLERLSLTTPCFTLS